MAETIMYEGSHLTPQRTEIPKFAISPLLSSLYTHKLLSKEIIPAIWDSKFLFQTYN